MGRHVLHITDGVKSLNIPLTDGQLAQFSHGIVTVLVNIRIGVCRPSQPEMSKTARPRKPAAQQLISAPTAPPNIATRAPIRLNRIGALSVCFRRIIFSILASLRSDYALGYPYSRRYLFVAIERATRWVFIAIYPNRIAANARRFLRDLERACPIRIRTILTDNG